MAITGKARGKAKDSERGTLGFLIGAIVGVVSPVFMKAFGINFLARFWFIVQGWLPNFIRSILPNWFNIVFYGILFALIGLIIEFIATSEN